MYLEIGLETPFFNVHLVKTICKQTHSAWFIFWIRNQQFNYLIWNYTSYSHLVSYLLNIFKPILKVAIFCILFFTSPIIWSMLSFFFWFISFMYLKSQMISKNGGPIAWSADFVDDALLFSLIQTWLPTNWFSLISILYDFMIERLCYSRLFCFLGVHNNILYRV